VFIFRLVECRCDCVGVPAYEIVDGYVAIVAEKLMFFDIDDRADVFDTDDIRDNLYRCNTDL